MSRRARRRGRIPALWRGGRRAAAARSAFVGFPAPFRQPFDELASRRVRCAVLQVIGRDGFLAATRYQGVSGWTGEPAADGLGPDQIALRLCRSQIEQRLRLAQSPELWGSARPPSGRGCRSARNRRVGIEESPFTGDDRRLGPVPVPIQAASRCSSPITAIACSVGELPAGRICTRPCATGSRLLPRPRRRDHSGALVDLDGMLRLHAGPPPPRSAGWRPSMMCRGGAVVLDQVARPGLVVALRNGG